MDIEEPGKNKKRRSRKKSSKMNSETNEHETGGEQQPDNGGTGGGSERERGGKEAGRGGNGAGRGGNVAGRGGNGAGRGGNGAGSGWNESRRTGNGRGGNSDGRGGSRGRPQYGESNNGWRGGNNQFEYYMDPAIIQSRGLAVNKIGPGTLLEGTLRINPKSYEDGFVCAPDSTSDIYIRGIRDRNRALQGDSVIVEVNPLNMWNVLNETIQDYLDTQGSEEDFKILLEGATFNMKKERGEEREEFDNKQHENKTKEEAELEALEAEVEALKAEAASRHKSAKIPLEPETAVELVVAARSLAAAVAAAEAPEYGADWGKKPVSESPWDVAEFKVDTFAQDILVQVQQGKKTRRGPRKAKGASSQPSGEVVAPDELEGLEDIEGSGVDSDHSIEDDLEQKIEAEAERLANLGLNPDKIFEKQFGVAVPSSDINISLVDENKESDEDVVVEGVGGEEEQKKEKKTRRRNRGKPKKGNKEENDGKSDLNDSVQIEMRSAQKPARFTKPAKVPRVEYRIENVMLHPLAFSFVQRTGRVVNILEFKHSRVAGGHIKMMADRNTEVALFAPTDSRVPRMKVPISQCPPNFLQRPKDFENTLFIARLETWETTNSATGSIIRSLGLDSDINARTEGLLLEYNIEYEEFPESVLNDLPENHKNWSIPDSEIQLRRDFRDECVFTIDPLTARDLDDALSVTQEKDGNYRVGVHIADVAYFVREGTDLDGAAASRTTSTYLVQKVVPMLPRPLCENLCSLNPGEDRLTYTVEWTINEDGEIQSEWFGRTVIRSCVKLAYEHAQSMIDCPERKDWTTEELPSIDPRYTSGVISEKVNMLQKLAVKIRERREKNGYLKLNQPKLCFSLNPETGLPDGFRLHEHRHSNKLIEEFMLLANMAVARKIFCSFPELSVLRRHPPPKKDMLQKTLEMMKGLGVDIVSSSAAQLGASIARVDDCPLKAAVVTCLISKPMELAKYFCTGTIDEPDFHHYALNVPYYTHFTSPIRRYPDILVHRLLDHAVRGTAPYWDSSSTQLQCNLCNDKRLAAKRAGEQSAELFLGLFVAECGPISQVGCVVGILDHAVDVLLVNLGVVKRVYMDRMEIKSFKTRRINAINYLDLEWKNGSKQTLTTFSRVELSLRKAEKAFEYLAVIEFTEDSNEVVNID